MGETKENPLFATTQQLKEAVDSIDSRLDQIERQLNPKDQCANPKDQPECATATRDDYILRVLAEHAQAMRDLHDLIHSLFDRHAALVESLGLQFVPEKVTREKAAYKPKEEE